MSFLDVDTTDAKEPTAVPGDQEYKLRIVSYIEKEVDGKLEKVWLTRNGNPCMMPIFEIPNEPDAKDFNHYIGLPHDEMSEKEKRQALWKLKQFKLAFNIPDGRVNLDDTIGNEGYAILGLREDPESGEQNFIKKFIVPKS